MGWRLLTALRDGSRGGQVPVLSVHVVGSTARVVAQPDAKVLHLQGRLLVHLKQTTSRRSVPAPGSRADPRSTYQATVDDLARSLLHLPQLGHKVPEAGFGHDVVGGEDPHPVQGGGRVLGRGQQAPDYFILPKL